jgi:phospholipid transport system transporter-binding protein
VSTPRLEKGRLEGHFRLSGELTFDTVPDLLVRSRQLFAACPALEIDLAGVDRVDSAGLALLTEWTRVAESLQQEIGFTNMPAQMRDLVRVSGLDNVLPFGRSAAQQPEESPP